MKILRNVLFFRTRVIHWVWSSAVILIRVPLRKKKLHPPRAFNSRFWWNECPAGALCSALNYSHQHVSSGFVMITFFILNFVLFGGFMLNVLLILYAQKQMNLKGFKSVLRFTTCCGRWTESFIYRSQKVYLCILKVHLESLTERPAVKQAWLRWKRLFTQWLWTVFLSFQLLEADVRA